MPRLDVYPLPAIGYVLDVQADLLAHLATRTVVPLIPEAAAPRPISELNPVFAIEGQSHVLVTQAIASVPLRELKMPIASLVEHHDQITRALDILLLGF